MTTHLFQFRFAVSEVCWLITLTSSILFVRCFLDFEQLQTRHMFGSFSAPSNGVASTTFAFRHFDRSPLRGRVILVSWLRWEDGAQGRLTGSSTFRIKCGDDGFHRDSLDVQHQSSTGDVQRARKKVLRVSYTGDNFASMSSVLTKWVFR